MGAPKVTTFMAGIVKFGLAAFLLFALMMVSCVGCAVVIKGKVDHQRQLAIEEVN
jgi:hypothetical protein